MRGNAQFRITDPLRHHLRHRVAPRVAGTATGPVRVIGPAVPQAVVRLTRVEGRVQVPGGNFSFSTLLLHTLDSERHAFILSRPDGTFQTR